VTGDEVGKKVHRLAGTASALEGEAKESLACASLAAITLGGLVANAAVGWWWIDPIAGYIIVCYAAKEAWQLLRSH